MIFYAVRVARICLVLSWTGGAGTQEVGYLSVTEEDLARLEKERGAVVDGYCWTPFPHYPRVLWFEDEADAAGVVLQLSDQYKFVGVEAIDVDEQAANAHVAVVRRGGKFPG